MEQRSDYRRKAEAARWPTVAVIVLDPGPIPHALLTRYDDPDIEAALEQHGYDPAGEFYRLIRLDVADLTDARWFESDMDFGGSEPSPLRIRTAADAPPIVVTRSQSRDGYDILDCLNRAAAHWKRELPTIRAYELLPA